MAGLAAAPASRHQEQAVAEFRANGGEVFHGWPRTGASAACSGLTSAESARNSASWSRVVAGVSALMHCAGFGAVVLAGQRP
jgi:hypothetical protein